MKNKYETLYDYLKLHYEEAYKARDSIRNRTLTTFTIFTSILVALLTIYFTSNSINKEINCIDIILLIFTCLFLFISLVFFILIIKPSKRKIRTGDPLIEKVKHPLKNTSDINAEEYIEKENKQVLRDFAIFFSKDFEELNKLNKYYSIYYLILTFSFIIALVLFSFFIGV